MNENHYKRDLSSEKDTASPTIRGITPGRTKTLKICGKIYNKKGQGHFIGTMVVAKNEDNKKLYDIIDGQQRTTTIFMLLHVLASEQNEKDKQETRKYLYQKGELKLEVALKTKASSKRSWKRQKRGISAIVKKMQTPRVSKISLRF
ncbi:hypothetical protein HpSIM21_04440 [Helicobacter pylori]|nr:hypothetical protein VN0926_00360 [Helicobacter pylori]